MIFPYKEITPQIRRPIIPITIKSDTRFILYHGLIDSGADHCIFSLEIAKELGIKFSQLDELLANSDFVSLHVPLTDETRHMVNKESLAKIKKGSFLVNTARGPVVEEDALVEALKSGHLGGAALDVYDNEPNIHPELIGMENVILTPHIASATIEAREEMCELAVSGLLSSLSGTCPANIVNKEVWEKRRK